MGVVSKIDFEKVYDCVDRGFMWFVLNKMGFGDKWIRWMRRCVGCARISVLVNGSTRDELKTERGLRQGCPLLSFVV